MRNLRPRKQSWRGNPPPSKADHNKFITGLKKKKLLNVYNRIIKEKPVFIRGRKERTKGASTCESGYVFRSETLFNSNEPWFICFDTPGQTLRMIIRPIPTNYNSVDIIPSKLKSKFYTCPDNNNWLQIYINDVSDENLARNAIDVLLMGFNKEFPI